MQVVIVFVSVMISTAAAGLAGLFSRDGGSGMSGKTGMLQPEKSFAVLIKYKKKLDEPKNLKILKHLV